MRARYNLLSTAALIVPALLVAGPLQAQSVTLDPPPIRQPLDENGVDLSSGQIVVPSSTLGIGGGDGLTHRRYRVANGWRHNYLISAEIVQGQTQATLNLGGSRLTFTLSGGVYVSDLGGGEKIIPDFATGTHTFIGRDGTQIIFKESFVANGESYYGPASALAEAIISPGGERTDLHYIGGQYQTEVLPGQFVPIYVVRLQSVTNNASYQLKFDYAADIPDETTIDDWYRITKVTGINNAVEYCDPAANNCNLTNLWPFLDYATTQAGSDTLETVTDALGRQARFRNDASGRLTGVKRPGESDDGVAIAYGADQRVSSVTLQGQYTRNYTWTTLGNSGLVAQSDDSLGRWRNTTASTNFGQLIASDDANGSTSYLYQNNRLDTVTAPEGNTVKYTYDARGNVTSVIRKPKPGSPLPDIITSASYPANCTNNVTCNLPASTTDARGNVTNFTYDPVHGGLTKIELPADGNGNRPTSEIHYTAYFARKKDAAGALITQTTSITKPTSLTRCRVAASCPGSADEQVIEVGYSNAASPNLLPTSVTRKAGDNTLTATTALTYDDLGQIKAIDGPLAGTSDTTTYRYDAVGQLEGVISPDPDGAGFLPHLATRLTYNADGQVTIAEGGTVTGTSDMDWTNFAPETKVVSNYDGYGRLASQAQVATSGNTQFSLVQYSYDAAGRPECTALRMNAPLTTTVLPASACTAMTPGSYGEDRISKQVYDITDRATEVWSGVGTGSEQKSLTRSYNANGTVDWIEDAKGNRTQYAYDGFDRTTSITYPSPNTPGTVNPADQEMVGYDAAGNITSHTNRMGEQFTLAYDNLGRPISKIVPDRTGLNLTHTRDVYYAYDLYGALTEARFDSNAGEGLSFGYDALGRLTSSTQALDGASRTIAYQYDAADRQTRVTHADGAYWQYQYDTLGRLKYILDDGSVAQIINLYNSDGSLASQHRDANAPDEHFYRDAAKRLDRKFTDHPNAAYDVTRQWPPNPAGQAIRQDIDNQLYVWDAQPQVDVNTSYVPDGLNRYASVNGNNFTYDANGNLTSDAVTSFVYDPENRLVSASGGNQVDLRYDPLGRLYEIKDAQGNIRRLLYDRDALIGEYGPTGTMLDRYVHGVAAGIDDPLIRYAGANADAAAAEYLYADRLGSIVASFTSSGAVKSINSYDEYGMPGIESAQANNTRFRYTGQIWLPELGQYYYKARMYSPGLGRFMQTDPIGYADGMNLYRYVGNDPVNRFDFTGLGYCVIPSDGPNDSKAECHEAGGTWFDCERGEDCGGEGPTIIVDWQVITRYVRPGGGFVLPGIGAVGAGTYSLPSLNLFVRVIERRPQNDASCPAPSNVNISGRIIVYGGSAAYARFDGTLTDVATGRSSNISAQGPGGGFGVGSYDVSGTVSGFGVLDGGFSIGFWAVGYGPVSLGGATIRSRGDFGRRLGSISVNGEVSAPAGAFDIGFRNVQRTQAQAGSSC